MTMTIFKKIALVSAMVMNAGILSANTLGDMDNSSELQSNFSYDLLDHDRRGRDTCYDERVDLVCKVNGRHQSVTGYIDCGRSYEGQHCSNVYVPGYRVLKMNVLYRCEYGRWRMQHISGQGCKLD